MLSGILVGALTVLLYLGALTLAFRAPRCPTCKTRLRTIRETARALGLYAVEMLVCYECSDCSWVTQRGHILTHL
jgi:uncharacterized protein with PIN domain